MQSIAGYTPKAVGKKGFAAGEADFPSLFISSEGTPYVVYEDIANGNKFAVMKYGR